MQLRKAKFIVPNYTYLKSMGLEPNKEIDVTVHGFFQAQDDIGSAEPIAIVELEDGRILEVSPSKLVMTDKPVDYNSHVINALNELISAFIDGNAKIRII